MPVYGYCPHCFAEVVSRTRGGSNAQDTCAGGHVYLSAFTLPSALLKEWADRVKATLQVVRDRLIEATIDDPSPLTPRDIMDLANRCNRTLEAIPLLKEV